MLSHYLLKIVLTPPTRGGIVLVADVCVEVRCC